MKIDNVEVNDVYGVVNAASGSEINQTIIQSKEHKVPKQLTATLGISTNFIGRENELKSINEKLTASNSLLLINGIGGVGKSTIASHYLQSKQDELDYYGFFEGIDHFVTELKKPLDLKSETTDDLFNEALWKLRELKGVKLLVIDDLKDIEEHEQTIAKILALKEHGYQILFTSREEMDNDKVTPFYLDVLNLTDAKNLFKAIYPVPIEDEPLLEAILGYLDCHTLFVELTAKTLKNKKTITLQGLKEKFDSGEFSKISIKRKESFGKYLSKLFFIDQLDNEETLVLKQLAVLPSIEIPFSLLQTIFGAEDNENLEEILNYLNEKGWLIASNDSYKLHQIIKEFILANYPPTFKTDISLIVENINSIVEKNIELNDDVKIEIITTIVAKYLTQDNKQVVQLSDWVIWFYDYSGKYKKALFIAQKALAIRKKTLGEQHLDIANSYNILGVIYDSQSNYNKALSFYKKALSIRENILGEQHPDTASSYSNLAVIYEDQGKISQALELHKKALVIRRNTLGEQDYDTANSYHNLALSYYVQSNYTQALELHKKALVIRKNILGKQHPDTASSYDGLALLYWEQENYSQALEFYKKSLKINENILEGKHPDLANAYHNITLFYQEQGNHLQALEFHEKALSIRKDILGGQHRDIADSYFALGLFHQEKNNYSQALQFHEKALSMRKNILGERHLVIANSYHGIGMIFHEQGKYFEALPFYRKALKIREDILGKQHPDIAMYYYILIVLFIELKYYGKAFHYAVKALNVYIHLKLKTLFLTFFKAK